MRSLTFGHSSLLGGSMKTELAPCIAGSPGTQRELNKCEWRAKFALKIGKRRRATIPEPQFSGPISPVADLPCEPCRARVAVTYARLVL